VTDSIFLVRYDAAASALAEAKCVSELKDIIDTAAGIKEYARRANNRQLEEDAVELRMKATRRLDELIKVQKETVGLATGTKCQLAGEGPGGLLINPPGDDRPTLASQGINKNLAHQARVLGRLSDEEFEEAVAEARAKASRSMRRVVNTIEIEQERALYRARTYQGGTVADLHRLAASRAQFGVIYADPPWPFDKYPEQGRQRSAMGHYEPMTLDEIKALPVEPLAADNCALCLWGVWPELPGVSAVIEAWGFEYHSGGFVWVKTNQDGEGLHWGMGDRASRANTEFVLIGFRGSPRRLAADVHQVIMAPVREHSEKPEEARRRIERLYPGPYLELFARRPVDGWVTWGNEVPAPLVPADPEATREAAE
jgi:N6-adenosine-specific RNA methylase IME4